MRHPYATTGFAESLAHWGDALDVPQWQTSIIVRDIAPGIKDAAGPYPFTALAKDADIAGGLAYLKEMGLVSVVLVLDDFHRPDITTLQKHFTKVVPFKNHFIRRRDKGEVEYDSHHRRALRQSVEAVRADVIDLKRDWKQWAALYDHLIDHLKLSGLHAFPHEHHHILANLDDVTGIGGWVNDELVSGHIWVTHQGRAHSHLVASNQKGYDTRAGFAVNDFSLKHFSDMDIVNFGGGAGNSVSADDGLARFKRGFANDEAQSYICGAILDEARYAALTREKNKTDSSFFPAYRAP